MGFFSNIGKGISKAAKKVTGHVESFAKARVRNVRDVVGTTLSTVVGGVISPFISAKTESAIRQQNAQVHNQIALDSHLFSHSRAGSLPPQRHLSTANSLSIGSSLDSKRIIPYVIAAVGLGFIYKFLIK